MNHRSFLFAAGLCASLAATTAQAAPVTYSLDPGHTMVLFTWDHFGFSKPTANIGLGEGKIVFDKEHPAKSSVQVTLPLSKLDTHVPALDEHLKAADFFDATKYPNISFKSTKIEPLGHGQFRIIGDLSVHGVTKTVVLKAKLNKLGQDPVLKKPAIGFDAVGQLKRSEFGVAEYTPGVSDEIRLQITTQADAAQ